jgi:hypothetical protein
MVPSARTSATVADDHSFAATAGIRGFFTNGPTYAPGTGAVARFYTDFATHSCLDDGPEQPISISVPTLMLL